MVSPQITASVPQKRPSADASTGAMVVGEGAPPRWALLSGSSNPHPQRPFSSDHKHLQVKIIFYSSACRPRHREPSGVWGQRLALYTPECSSGMMHALRGLQNED